MTPRPFAPASISVEVGTQPLPLSMRLASARNRSHLPSLRKSRGTRAGVSPVLPVIGVATMAFGMRRGRRLG